LNECFELLGKTARAKPCKGMMGLVEEGQDVIGKQDVGEQSLTCAPARAGTAPAAG